MNKDQYPFGYYFVIIRIIIPERVLQRKNEEGYYGEFGGAYIPEILHRCVEEVDSCSSFR